MIAFLKEILRGQKWRIALIILIDIIEVGLSLLFVWYSKIIIDVATKSRTGSLQELSFVLVGIIVVQIALRMYDQRLRNTASTLIGNTIRRKIYRHLLFTKWEELSKLHSGDMLTRIIRDTDDIVNIIISGVPLLISASLQFIGSVWMLLHFDWTLALAIGVGFPFLLAFSKIYYTRMRKYSLEIKANQSRITEIIGDGLRNQLVIRTFEKQPYQLDVLRDAQDVLFGNIYKRTSLSIFANTAMRIAFQGGYITAFLWSVYGLAKNTITFGTVTAYLQLVARVQRPVFDLMGLLPSFISAKTAAERLMGVLESEQEQIATKPILSDQLSLHVNDISFSYQGEEQPTISNMSFRANAGEMIGIVGETGAGKTTLIRLLLGLMQPQVGEIILRDKTTRFRIDETTRSNFVYVPQGNSVVSGTIRDNLKIGHESATLEQMTTALKAASATFVFDLKDGIDTVIGENGIGLSEGQAQRISIARALLRPGKIVLLDEATSALDQKTEQNFLSTLKANMGNRIVIFITHHSAVSDMCDKLIELR